MPAAELLYQHAQELAPTSITMINATADPLLGDLCRSTAYYKLSQHFRPQFNALESMQLKVAPLPQFDSKMTLMLPSKQKQQSLAWMAEAMLHLQTGGTLIAACANRYGGKSYETALKRLAGSVQSSAKSKCRIFQASKTNSFNSALAHQWIADAAPRFVDTHHLLSRPGLFCWDRIDQGSSLLLEHLPQLSGSGMDLCSGLGLLSVHMLKQNPEIKRLTLVEADHLALGCAEENTQTWTDKVTLQWCDAVNEALPQQLDWVVCNPPFHSGQERDTEMGRRILVNGCRTLRKGGSIYIVANRKLPYEQQLKPELSSMQILCERDGFKVIRGIR